MCSMRKQAYENTDASNQPAMVDDAACSFLLESMSDDQGVYRFLLEHMSEAVWQVSPDLRFTYINPANERLFGHRPEEVIGRSIFDFMTPGSADYVREIVAERRERARRGERLEKLMYEVEHVCRDGRIIWVEVVSNPVYDSQGRLTMFNGITRDITARKQAEQAFQDAETRYRLLFEHSPDGIVIINPVTAQFQEFNETAHRQLGYSREEFSRLSISDVEMDETPERIQAHITKVIQEGRDDFETRHRTKQGEIRNIRVTAQLTETLGKTVYHCIWRDITEQKRMEDETAVLVGIGQIIASTLNIDEVYERFAVEVRKLIPFDRIHVNLRNPDGETFTIAYTSGIDIAGRRPGDKVRLAGSISEAPCRTRTGLLLHPANEAELAGRFPNASSVTTFRAGMKSIMAVPLISQDEVIGILHFRSKMRNLYTPKDLLLAERIASQIAGAVANAQLFAELKSTKDLLQDSEKILKNTLDDLEITIAQRTLQLEEINTTLRVLVKKGDKDQQKMEESLQSNINQLVTPFLSKLRVSISNPERLTYLNILETNLNNIVSPFINRLSAAYKNLTPKEIQIAELIKQGKGSKEIAELFGLSVGTVVTHRNNIRKKLGLKFRGANLRSHLLSLS